MRFPLPSLAALAAGASATAVSNRTYDYIVVGGGPSGIVAATRLAQTNKTVLLLERGQGPTVATGANDTLTWNDTLTYTDLPGLSGTLASIGDVFSSYLCDDVAGYAGCVLGGGSTVNYMVFPHPPDHDFDDAWPAGWKWADVAPAADRVWALNPGTQLPSADGKRYDQGMWDVFSGFLASLGWKWVDQNEERNEKTKVYSYPNWDIGNQLRVGPVRTYLPIAEQYAGFEYQLHARVRRVLRCGPTAIGVEVETSSGVENITLSSGGAVVLAAGSWNTPRLLIQSGIGPVDQIQTVQNGTTGIVLPPQKDWIELPVGQGLKDHPIFSITIQTGANFTGFNNTKTLDGTATDIISLYEQHASGILTQGYHRLTFWTSAVGPDGVTRNYQGSVSPQGTGKILIKAYMTHGLTSTGAMGIGADGSGVQLQSPYLQTEGDKEAATAFLTEFLADVQSYAGFNLTSSTNVTELLESYSSGDHYVGTAVIGEDRETSVVDTNVKVHGMDNLYVVDASIHADLPTGNTQAIVMVVAEAAVAKVIAQTQ